MNTFTAIDFETATGYRDSACAIALVRVDAGQVVDAFRALIRPPGNYYWSQFTDVHGLDSAATAEAPPFARLWPAIRRRIVGRVLVAHNSRFDRGVLEACVGRFAPHDVPLLGGDERWRCTLSLARRRGQFPAGLAECCRALDIPLQHHEALSDALACAQLWLRWNKAAEVA